MMSCAASARAVLQLGSTILADPEKNPKALRQLLHWCESRLRQQCDAHHGRAGGSEAAKGTRQYWSCRARGRCKHREGRVVKMAMASLLAVLKDISPGYGVPARAPARTMARICPRAMRHSRPFVSKASTSAGRHRTTVASCGSGAGAGKSTRVPLHVVPVPALARVLEYRLAKARLWPSIAPHCAATASGCRLRRNSKSRSASRQPESNGSRRGTVPARRKGHCDIMPKGAQ